MPSFAVLWANHPNVKGDAPLLDRGVYENQCAINVGAALMRSGVDLGSLRSGYGLPRGAVGVVLASALRRVAFIVAGALTSASLGFVAGSLLTNWYADTLARSQDDIDDVATLALVSLPVLMVLGGYLGHRLHCRANARRVSGRS